MRILTALLCSILLAACAAECSASISPIRGPRTTERLPKVVSLDALLARLKPDGRPLIHRNHAHGTALIQCSGVKVYVTFDIVHDRKIVTDVKVQGRPGEPDRPLDDWRDPQREIEKSLGVE